MNPKLQERVDRMPAGKPVDNLVAEFDAAMRLSGFSPVREFVESLDMDRFLKLVDALDYDRLRRLVYACEGYSHLLTKICDAKGV